MNENDEHSNLLDFMWASSAADMTPWIQFEFAQVQKLDKVHVWNHNSQTESILGYGIKEAKIETSTDGETWTEVKVAEIPQATGMPDYAGADVSLDGATGQYIRLRPHEERVYLSSVSHEHPSVLGDLILARRAGEHFTEVGDVHVSHCQP